MWKKLWKVWKITSFPDSYPLLYYKEKDTKMQQFLKKTEKKFQPFPKKMRVELSF